MVANESGGRMLLEARRYSYESCFGGGVEVLTTSGSEPSIYYANGAMQARGEPALQEITAQTGRSAFAIRLTGERIPDKSYVVGRDIPQNVQAIIPMQQAREAATLLGVITERFKADDQGVDAIFQSEAAGHGIIAAYAQPAMFNGIVLAFPGSINGPQGFRVARSILREGILGRTYRPMPEDDFRGPRSKGSRLAGFYQQIKASGFWADAAALRHSALAPMLHSMRGRDDAPSVTLVAGLDDQLFTPESLLSSLVASTDIDQMIVVPGNHAIKGRREVMAAILGQFPFMTKLRTLRQQARSEDRPLPTPPLRDRLHLPPNTPHYRKVHLYQLAEELDRRTFDH